MSPASNRPTEITELTFAGPFGGIQSESALVQMETFGFADSLNIVFYDGVMMPKPGLFLLPPPASGPIQGIFDFFDAIGNRHTGVWCGGSIWELTSGATWHQKTGTLTNTTATMSWTVVGGKLLFSQGTDPVQVWDGVATTFAAVSANATPAYHLGELNFCLIACPTVEAGVFAPQRMRWTTPGDPTQWTGGNSGISDMFNDLGPIRGWRKIYTMGYIFQRWGITAQQPTGNAITPWILYPLSSKQKGLCFDWTLSGTGEFAVYAGQDNIYLFNGSSSEPIGDLPLQGKAWLGARDRILSDLYATGSSIQAHGYYLSVTKSHEYATYWLLIPGQSTWVFNFKEQNWCRFNWPKVQSTTSVMYSMPDVRATQINQLVGTIGGLAGSIISLSGSFNIGDSAAIGFSNGQIGYFDWDEPPDSAWSLTTGTLAFGDTRHSKDIRRVRMVMEADTQVDITISATNEQGQTQTTVASFSAAPGRTQNQVFPFHLPGFFTTFSFSGPPAQSFELSEISVGYGIGREASTQ